MTVLLMEVTPDPIVTLVTQNNEHKSPDSLYYINSAVVLPQTSSRQQLLRIKRAARDASVGVSRVDTGWTRVW